VWSSFTKWCAIQIESQRAITLQNFGTVGYQPIRENVRIVYLQLNEYFMSQHKLQYHPQMEEVEAQTNVVLTPTTKPAFPVMAKTANMEKNVFHSSLLNIFTLIGELLADGKNVEIDLLEFGKFQGMSGQIMYAPFNKIKPSGSQGKQTVKNLMDLGPVGRGETLPPIDHPMRESYEGQNTDFRSYQASMSYGANGLQASMKGPGGKTSTFSASMNDSPTRRYKKPANEGKIASVLLGAGDDPQLRQQEFSLLASDPAALMKQSFKKPAKAISRFPPVIDPFSRTLAAPCSSQKHYLSVCHKVGTNYTPSAKGFYIDTDIRVVKYKDISDTGCKLDIVGDNDVEPADEAEEYMSICYP